MLLCAVNSPLFVLESSSLTPHRNALESCLFSFKFLNLVHSDVEAQCAMCVCAHGVLRCALSVRLCLWPCGNSTAHWACAHFKSVPKFTSFKVEHTGGLKKLYTSSLRKTSQHQCRLLMQGLTDSYWTKPCSLWPAGLFFSSCSIQSMLDLLCLLWYFNVCAWLQNQDSWKTCTSWILSTFRDKPWAQICCSAFLDSHAFIFHQSIYLTSNLPLSTIQRVY